MIHKQNTIDIKDTNSSIYSFIKQMCIKHLLLARPNSSSCGFNSNYEDLCDLQGVYRIVEE